jgi:phage gpG-like protein
MNDMAADAYLTYTVEFESGDSETFSLEYDPAWTDAKIAGEILLDIGERLDSFREESENYGDAVAAAWEIDGNSYAWTYYR